MKATRVCCFLTIAITGLFWAGAATAGPNCDRKPDHPSCAPDGGGGGDGGGTDACAVSTAPFPALAYQRSVGKGRKAKIEIVLADADGACQRPVATLDGFPRDIAFSYNVPNGRLIWTRDDRVWMTEVAVDGNDVSVTKPAHVLVDAQPDSVLLFASLSEDGERLAFTLDELRGTSGGNDDRYSVRLLDGLSDLPCDAPCSPGDASVVYAIDEQNPGIASASVNRVRWNDDGDRLYARLSISDGAGSRAEILILEEATAGSWTSSVLFDSVSEPLLISEDHAPGQVDTGDGRGPREVLALFASSDDRCNEQTYVIDVEDCTGDQGSACGPINASFQGRFLGGWTPSGTLILEDGTPVDGTGPGGGGLCEFSGNILDVDLFATGAPVIRTLVEGGTPDAG